MQLRASFVENNKQYGWQVPCLTFEEAMSEAATIIEKFAAKERPVTDLVWKVYA